jgi:hypothetical protein
MQTEGLSTMEGTPLDEKARRMLVALKALGPGWHSRTAIAAQIGKNRLNPVDMITLDMLAAAGKIDRAMLPKPDMPQVNQWVYQSKE